MSWQRWILAILIVIVGTIQYGLVVYALRDLIRRPRVRGENKVTWALVILTLPFLGAVLYATFGPTSFLPRSLPAAVPARAVPPPRRRPRWMTQDPGDDAA